MNNSHNKLEPIKVTVQVNSADLQMEVDTGVATSVINNCRYQQLCPKNKRPPLHSTKTIKDKHYQGQTAQLKLVVVTGTGLSLLGLQQLLE